jgi:hypothetical protein
MTLKIFTALLCVAVLVFCAWEGPKGPPNAA